jgi:hypothetical protein
MIDQTISHTPKAHPPLADKILEKLPYFGGSGRRLGI